MNSTIRPDVLDEAAGWLVEFRAGNPDAAQCRAFDDWLRTSPEHVRAYLTLLPTWESAGQIDLHRIPSTALLIEWARGVAENIVPHPRQARSTPSATLARREPHKGRRRIYAAAATGVLACGLAAYWAYQHAQHPTYTTAVGEQRSLRLPDGSTVELNALSRAKVHFDESERRVDLLEGQALFRVARESGRPFIVRSGKTDIRALGTQFDVYRKATGTVVTVVEGKVAVQRESGDEPQTRNGSPLVLTAGEQLVVAPKVLARPTPANVKAATAWTQRRLIFSAAPLTEVASEFNRYNARHLVIESRELEHFRINGVFSSADPSALIGFLREQPGMAVTETEREIRIARK
jgi:transmembrane sensor